MDKIEKFILKFSILFLIVFFFAILVISKGIGKDVPECVPADQPFTEGHVAQLDDRTYQINYVARMWFFDPLEVAIPRGSEVDIYLTSIDVVHGFHIKEKDINMMAVPGAIGLKTVRFDEPGEYNIICHEFCGIGHQQMTSKIIVE